MGKKSKPLTKLKQSGLQRRLAVAAAGVSGGAKLLGSHAGSVFKSQQEKSAARESALAEQAVIFARKLGELKGAYVKIGQMMALYGEYLLPAPVTAALRELESQAEAMDWTAIEPQIQSEIGAQAAELEIQQHAIAAASLSQVHCAKHIDEQTTLCLKIQYPGVASTIHSDFATVLTMLKLARWIPSGQQMETWLQEMKQMLLDEVDYSREAQMMARVVELVGSDERYLVPQVEPRYSSSKVLAMEFVEGLLVTDARITRLSQTRRNQLATAMLENFFAEVFEWGCMQTDPNFGNYLIQLRKAKTVPDKLVLLDFGAVRELSSEFQSALQQTILAAHQRDVQAIIDGAIRLGCLRPQQTLEVKHSFADFCMLLMEPFRSDHADTPKSALNANGEYSWHNSNLLPRVGKAGAHAMVTEGFSSPPKEFALIARKLTGVFSFITALKAEFNAAPLIDKYL